MIENFKTVKEIARKTVGKFFGKKGMQDLENSREGIELENSNETFEKYNK
jgi:hypothetical protein